MEEERVTLSAGEQRRPLWGSAEGEIRRLRPPSPAERAALPAPRSSPGLTGHLVGVCGDPAEVPQPARARLCIAMSKLRLAATDSGRLDNRRVSVIPPFRLIDSRRIWTRLRRATVPRGLRSILGAPRSSTTAGCRSPAFPDRRDASAEMLGAVHQVRAPRPWETCPVVERSSNAANIYRRVLWAVDGA